MKFYTTEEVSRIVNVLPLSNNADTDEEPSRSDDNKAAIQSPLDEREEPVLLEPIIDDTWAFLVEVNTLPWILILPHIPQYQIHPTKNSQLQTIIAKCLIFILNQIPLMKIVIYIINKIKTGIEKRKRKSLL